MRNRRHAPAGGTEINCVPYAGGQFLPGTSEAFTSSGGRVLSVGRGARARRFFACSDVGTCCFPTRTYLARRESLAEFVARVAAAPAVEADGEIDLFTLLDAAEGRT